MASSLVLDRSDPGVNDLVSQWKDGETYQVTLTIVQKNSSPNTAHYDVTSIEAEEAEPPEETPPAMPMRGAMRGGPPAPIEY